MTLFDTAIPGRNSAVAYEGRKIASENDHADVCLSSNGDIFTIYATTGGADVLIEQASAKPGLPLDQSRRVIFSARKILPHIIGKYGRGHCMTITADRYLVLHLFFDDPDTDVRDQCLQEFVIDGWQLPDFIRR
jgi:hypothetical protein